MDIKKINQYEAFHKIGESVSSVIYKAYDSEKQTEVSVKQLKPSDSIKRDFHQIKKYIGIKNKNLCRVHAVEKYEDSIIIVSDYVDGTPLQQLLLKSEYEKEKLLGLLLQINNGLAALHKENLSHGNLKPSNIIITENGQVILTDFGISPFEDFQNSPEFVAPYEAYHFLTPEQVLNEAVTFQSDFFAMGVIAYRILFGKLPFIGTNEDELVRSILEHYPNFTKLDTGSHNGIISLLLTKLLAKNQKDRFVDTAELGATLKEIQLINQNSNSYISLEKTPKNPRKYLPVSVLAALVIILWFILYLSS